MFLHKSKFKILLPIEIISREFDYKLILSSYLISDTCEVIIGQHDILFQISQFITNGVYIGKNSMSRREDGTWYSERHSAIKERNIDIFHLDEEGAVYHGETDYWIKKISELRVDRNAFDSKDFVLTWGEFQANVFKNFDSIDKRKVFISGHPKFDLPSKEFNFYFEDDIKKIKEKYNSYVLINTNFGQYNNSLGNKDSLSPRMGYKVNDENERMSSIEMWSYVGKTFLEFIKMITTVSIKFPDKNFVIRPHPGEDLDVYYQIFNDVKNVFIERENSVIPWILASDLIIHDGCTTAVEAYFSGKPVLNFHPFHDSKTYLYLPNQIGIECRDINSVINYLDKKESLLSEPSYRKLESDNLSKSLIKNINVKGNSFESIKDFLSDSVDFNKKSQVRSINLVVFLMFYKLKTFIKDLIRPFFSNKYRRYQGLKALFPGFDKKETVKKIALLNSDRLKIKSKLFMKEIIILNKE